MPIWKFRGKKPSNIKRIHILNKKLIRPNYESWGQPPWKGMGVMPQPYVPNALTPCDKPWNLNATPHKHDCGLYPTFHLCSSLEGSGSEHQQSFSLALLPKHLHLCAYLYLTPFHPVILTCSLFRLQLLTPALPKKPQLFLNPTAPQKNFHSFLLMTTELQFVTFCLGD